MIAFSVLFRDITVMKSSQTNQVPCRSMYTLTWNTNYKQASFKHYSVTYKEDGCNY